MDPHRFEDAVRDADSDGVLNVEELNLKLNPLWDFSLGIASDWEMAQILSDQNWLPPFSALEDADGDGLSDLWEYRYGFDLRNPLTPDEDADADGLSNREEFAKGTHPLLRDNGMSSQAQSGEAGSGAVAAKANSRASLSPRARQEKMKALAELRRSKSPRARFRRSGAQSSSPLGGDTMSLLTSGTIEIVYEEVRVDATGYESDNEIFGSAEGGHVSSNSDPMGIDTNSAGEAMTTSLIWAATGTYSEIGYSPLGQEVRTDTFLSQHTHYEGGEEGERWSDDHWWWQHGKVRLYLRDTAPGAPSPGSQTVLATRVRVEWHYNESIEDWEKQPEQILEIKTYVLGSNSSTAEELSIVQSYSSNNDFVEEYFVFAPVELIRKNNNSAYDPSSEALGVSNYVTTDGLPQDSLFADTCADPENFRLQAKLPNASVNSLPMKLEVIRGGSTVGTYNYTLDKKDGDFVRGRFLRLVTDTNDDAASGVGASSDANNQTVLVKLGDTIKASYDIATGVTVKQELQVGRPSGENDNGTTDPWKHDIREVKCRFVVFGNAATAAQIDQEIDTLNERFAQCGIKMNVIEKKLSEPLPTAFATGGFTRGATPIVTANADELEVLNHLDADNNTVDFMYVPNLNSGLSAVRATAYRAGRNATGNAAFQNFVVVGPTRTELSVAHELMHILLNISHRKSALNAWLDATTALFHGTTTKAVDGTKRIGPYPAAAAGVGNDDTTTIRNNAEQLP